MIPNHRMKAVETKSLFFMDGIISIAAIHYQYFTKVERIPENRGAGIRRTPVFGLLLIISRSTDYFL